MKFFLVLGLAATLAAPSLAQEAADAEAGEKVFARCSSCHDVGDDARNRMGPYLTGVVGRPAAAVEGFTYSQAMTAARDAGLVWTPETLDAFISAPHDYVPGTKMPNLAVKQEAQRANLVAYLVSMSPDFDPAAAISTYMPGGDAPAASSQTTAQ